MESVMQLLLEGLDNGDVAIDICRARLRPLVERGLLPQAELDALVADIGRGLRRRREALIGGARRELLRLLSLLPLVAEDRFQELEERVRALESPAGGRPA